MKSIKSILALLGISSAVLMSIPFLVPHTGFLALVGLVPLLLMEAVAEAHGVRRFFWWYYGTFVLWNAITTFWVCNATVGGGVFAVLANALQMAVIFWVFRSSRKRLGDVLSYVFLAALWIAWERFYLTSADISWPWLVLGNSFARSIGSIQWYEYTGTLGGSLWVWASNITVFLLVRALMQGTFGRRGPKAAVAGMIWTAVLFIGPYALSWGIWNRYEEQSTGKMDVVIAQPNFDPYHKFEALSQAQQDVVLLDVFEREMKHHVPGRPTLLLAPETFTNDVVLGHIEEGYTWNRFLAWLDAYPDANMLFGASSREIFTTEQAPSVNAYHLKDGRWLESHNSALMMDRTGRTELFHKSKLVVGVEMTPYPGLFIKLDNLLGGVMGRCIGQDEVSLLHAVSYAEDGTVAENIPLGSIICYESIYGEYCADYIRKGARALCVITNDAWWGNTPGYRQHLSYSSLRAIETRRDIARCANTGISAFIDQKGRIFNPSEWWKSDCLRGEVNLNDKVTFFVAHGDVVGRVCCFVALLLCLLLFVRSIVSRKA